MASSQSASAQAGCPRSSVALHRFILLTALTTFALLGAGGLVTSHGVGMAVPDWPNTYGYNLFLFPVSKWLGGIFYEHTHRLIASLVGLLATILAGWLWARETKARKRWLGLAALTLVLLLMGVRQMPIYVALASLAPVIIAISLIQIRKEPGSLRWWGMIAFAAVILQGVLGGLRVVWFKDEIGIFHGTLAQLFFVLICGLALVTSRWWQEICRVLSLNSLDHSRCVTSGTNDKQFKRRDAKDAEIPSCNFFSASFASLRFNKAYLFLRQFISSLFPTKLLLGTSLLILAQLALGATMRHQHAGLAIPDFPLAYGNLWPAMDPESVLRYNQRRQELVAFNPITAFQIALQMSHRVMAFAILAAVTFCSWSSRRRLGSGHPISKLSLVWLGLISLQGLLGAATIWSNKAADIATAHVLIGALSLAMGAMLWVISRKLVTDSLRTLKVESSELNVPFSNQNLQPATFNLQP